MGNMHFETSKSRLQKKTEFTALLSSKRTASHNPLFDESGNAMSLFTARPAKWKSSQYTWTDSDGHQVAIDDRKGEREQHRLVITRPMAQDKLDALVGLWVLRLWYENAETKQAKREGQLFCEK